MTRFRTLTLAALTLGILGAPGAAFADIKIEKAWVRATVGASKVSAGYAVISNNAPDADALVAVAMPGAGSTELHESKDSDGMMTMEPVETLAIPARGQVELRPGGYHIMIMNLDHPLKVGETAELTFTFKHKGAVKVPAKVLPLSATGLE